jgi:hypothetical protein
MPATQRARRLAQWRNVRHPGQWHEQMENTQDDLAEMLGAIAVNSEIEVGPLPCFR